MYKLMQGIYVIQGRSRENFSVDRVFTKFFFRQLGNNLYSFVRNAKKLGVTEFVSGII